MKTLITHNLLKFTLLTILLTIIFRIGLSTSITDKMINDGFKYFAEMWAKHVGKMKLIYTRNRIGRLELLKARNKSLSAAFRPKSERVTRWT